MYLQQFVFRLVCLLLVLPALIKTSPLNAEEFLPQKLTFAQTIKQAQRNDPWLKGNYQQQIATESMSIYAASLPDPKVSIGIANLATDTLAFDQEGMTQLKVGVAQMFPRGDTLALQQQQLRIQSQQFPFQRHDRLAKVAVTVGSLWLDIHNAQATIALIEKNRALFEQLSDIAQANYSSALRNTRQQEVVRAQLELVRLDDRLNQLEQKKSRLTGQLLPWLYAAKAQISGEEQAITLGDQLPQIALKHRKLIEEKSGLTPNQLVPFIENHPLILAHNKKIAAMGTGIKLAKQKYQPQWGVNASYAYRDDDPMGNNRADLLSVGVTFDVPLFTDNRQDQELKAAVARTESIKTEKTLVLRQLMAAYFSAKGRLQRLNERNKLYELALLPQMHDQAEASLTAYTNDDGDFSEVVRARIAELNAEIDMLSINTEQQKIILEINYLFTNGRDHFSADHIDASIDGELQ